MENIITLNDVSKEFKILNRREGLKGSFMDLFSRDYRVIRAVNHISLEIGRGEIVGYLGPNGAGKSTTIKMMTGVLEPTSGEILINGIVPYKKRSQNAQKIGVVFGQRSQLWWALPLIESLKILKEIYQVSDEAYQEMMNLYTSLVDISDLLHKPVRQMSLGQRTLSDILAAFLHNPSVVFLDEPTIGLDVSMKGKIRKLVKALNKEKGTTVILTTHDMGDVDALCRRVVIIDKGTLLYDNDIEHLKRFFGAYRTARVRLGREAEELKEEAVNRMARELEEQLKAKWPQAKSLTVQPNESWIDVLINEDEIALMKVVGAIQEHHRIYDMKLEEISTESVIRKIYEGGIE